MCRVYHRAVDFFRESSPSTLTRRSAPPSPSGRGNDPKVVPLPLGEGGAERRVRVEGRRNGTFLVFSRHKIGKKPVGAFDPGRQLAEEGVSGIDVGTFAVFRYHQAALAGILPRIVALQ